MLNVHGYSPYQLVFGQNPNLPSVLVDKLPALEGTTVSAKVGEHISALHASRKAFTEAESSERIRRALRKQLRPTDDMYVTGDKVYYKRADCPEWKGPGVLIGQDGAVVFVRHEGTLVRVHQSRLCKTNTQDQESQDKQNEQDNSQKVIEKGSLNNVADDSDSEENTDSDQENISDRELNTGEVVYPRMTQTETDHDVCGNPVSSAGVKLTTGQTVTFMKQDGSVQRAKVLGRTGKASGKYKNWFNLQHLNMMAVMGKKGQWICHVLIIFTLNQLIERMMHS